MRGTYGKNGKAGEAVGTLLLCYYDVACCVTLWRVMLLCDVLCYYVTFCVHVTVELPNAAATCYNSYVGIFASKRFCHSIFWMYIVFITTSDSLRILRRCLWSVTTLSILNYLRIFVPLWFVIISSVCFCLNELLFSGSIKFTGNFVRGQNSSRYRDWVT